MIGARIEQSRREKMGRVYRLNCDARGQTAAEHREMK
jgi:YD repeat-containing protein